MRFNGGYLGACIIVLSLLLGIAGGLMLNVDTSSVATTKYDYVTDITGLFDTSQEPQYIDYEPATNYTGYTNTTAGVDPSGITYTHTSTNNYRMTEAYGSTATGSNGTVDNSTSLSQVTFAGGSYMSGGSFTTWLKGYKTAYLSTWLTDVFGDISAYSTIQIDFTYPGQKSDNAFISYSYGTGLPQFGGGQQLTGRYPDTIIIDTVSGTYNMIGSNVPDNAYSIYTSFISYGNATYYEIPPGQYSATTTSTSLSLTYTSTLTTAPTYAYMLPADGVGLLQIPNDTDYYSTEWDNATQYNNYEVVQMSVIVGPEFDNGEFVYNDGALLINVGVRPYVDYPDFNDNVIGIVRNAGAYELWAGRMSYNNPGVLTDWAKFSDLGTWKGIAVVINDCFTYPYSQMAPFSIYGVVSFNNYQDFTLTPEPLAEMSAYYGYQITNYDDDGYNWSHIQFTPYSTYDPLNWSVYDTRVFMNTYNTVMINPSIDLEDYWPDMDSYRYSFQSFAVYGDQLTINGETYNVDNGQITIGYDTYDLTNFFISFSEQGHTWLTFNDIQRTIDLGETIDKIVSFSGYWYFNAGLYEGSLSTDDVYDWTVGDVFSNLNIQTFTLLSLGLIFVLCLGAVALKVNFKVMDKVVIAFGVVFLFCLLGGS